MVRTLKKTMIILLAFCALAFAQSQSLPQVAVYVTGAKTDNENRALGARMTDALFRSGHYRAIERAAVFLDQVAAEQATQRSDAIDDKQISALGQQNGAKYVCIVEIVEAFGSNQISGRIVNVETVVIVASGVTEGPLRTMEDAVARFNELVAKMFGGGGAVRRSAGGGGGNIRDERAGIDMVFVQGGTFLMGCTSEQANCDSDERPVRSVTVSDFYIGKYEVTQAQWRLVMGGNPSNFKGDNLPVEMVSWMDVQDFIERLNAMTGRRYRLATEAEWEFAARGGRRSNGYRFSGSNHIDDVAWYDGNSGRRTRAVGGKEPNELGIYDMSGNVWEWVSDWFGTYSSSNETNPRGASSGSYRVLRGGSWLSDARYCRVSNRGNDSPGGRGSDLGFRLALSPQ